MNFLQVPQGMAVLLLGLGVGAAEGAPVQGIFRCCLSQTAILTFRTAAASQSVFFSHLKLNFFE